MSIHREAGQNSLRNLIINFIPSQNKQKYILECLNLKKSVSVSFQSLALLESELPVKLAVLNVLQQFSSNSGKKRKKILHTCQVLGKSKSEIARAPLIFAYNSVIERAEKSGAQVLRVRFFSLFKQT